jgi:hypothetical protein
MSEFAAIRVAFADDDPGIRLVLRSLLAIDIVSEVVLSHLCVGIGFIQRSFTLGIQTTGTLK